MKLDLFCDGACRGNPGESSAGAWLLDRDSGKTVAALKKRIGRATNNEAEYEALLMGLEEAKRLGATDVRVKADSQLVIRQIRGEYKVKHPEMKRRHEKALALLSKFERWEASHVPREENTEADRLANEALDQN